MKRFILVFSLLMIGMASFADARSDATTAMEKAFTAMEKARVERQEAWDELYNCKMMSLEEFTAEYKKNHFALNSYDNEWSPSLHRAFKKYMAEVEQTQKELWNIYYEKEAKEEKAEVKYEEEFQAYQAEFQAEIEECQAYHAELQAEFQARLAELQAEIDELSKDGNK